MFRTTVVVTVLPLVTALPARADDVTPALQAGVWYAEVGGLMTTRYEYTFRKDGTFKAEILNDVPTPPATGTWKVAAKGGGSQLVLATKGGTAHLLPAESEVRLDKAKNALVVCGKGVAEVTLKFRKGR